MEQKNSPEIRCSGFTDEWQEYSMGELYTERKEPGNDSLPILSVSIHTGISDGELDEEGLGKTVRRNEDKSTYKHVYAGDLVFNMMRAWQGAIGSAPGEGMISPAYICAKPNEKVYPLFIDYYVKRKELIEQINSLSYGVTDFRKRLYWDSFVKVKCKLPSVEEQKWIADMIAVYDEVITASEQEIANLETLKKAVMKKIFSQEVRFKREDGTGFPEWEEKMLGSYCNIVTGKLDANAMIEDGEYDFYTSGIAKYKIDVAAFEGPAITIAGNGATVGYMHLADGKFNAYQRTYVLTKFKALREYLFYAIGDRLPLKIMKEARAGNIPYIVMDMLTELYVALPCIEEQRLIAGFLSDFDEAIISAKKELELWKELKKGLIQQMFV